MKRFVIGASSLLFLMSTSLVVAADNADKGKELSTARDKFSYALGAETAKNFQLHNMDVDPGMFSEGFRDGLTDDASKNLKMTDAEIRTAIINFQKDLSNKKVADMQEQYQENKEKGDAFLLENKNNKDVKTLPDGLQYKVLTVGKGQTPSANDFVTVDYTGKLLDGTVFDSSVERGKPAVFPVSGVIKGWTEALQLMPEGSKWTLYIPEDLAYGKRGGGDKIQPGSMLIFDVELLKVQSPESMKKGISPPAASDK